MSRLSPLRSQLTALAARRHSVRLGIGLAALAVAVLWALAAVFLCDWLFTMSRAQRVVAMIIAAGSVVWAFRRYTLPYLNQRESVEEMALLVERQQRIDSDLVAALQFEASPANAWGSTQLQGAVIDYVADYSRGLDLFEGFDFAQFKRRAALLVATVAVVVLAVVAFPDFAKVFLNRLALGSQHYPTRTHIATILVNGQPVEFAGEGSVVAKSAYGRPLSLAVIASGELPQQGAAQLTALTSGVARPLELKRDESAAANENGEQYTGELPQLIDSVSFQIYLGDAFTDPLRLEVIPLPVVEPKLTPVPPKYAQGSLAADEEAGQRQLSVIEGSRVEVELACLNKRLTAAVLTIDEKPTPLAFPLAAKDAAGKSWSLNVAGTPLAQVVGPLRYSLQVTDEDGLGLVTPIEGYVRIKADRKPTVSADFVTQYVLPTAAPTIHYRIADDYGIAEVRLRVEALVPGAPEPQLLETVVIHAADQPPVLREKLPLRAAYTLALSPLVVDDNGRPRKLLKGDQVRVAVEVVDYRGQQKAAVSDGANDESTNETTPATTAAALEGKLTASDPLVFFVTDESGIVASISEADERSARKLDDIIERQLETGGSK